MRKIFLPGELYHGIENMSNNDKGLLFDYIYRYNLGLECKLEPSISVVFGFFKPFFDGDIDKYNRYIDSKKNNPKGHGRPKKDWENEQKAKETKKTKKAKKTIDKTRIDIEYFNNKDVNKVFIEFLDMRRSIDKYPTDRAIELLVNKLNKYNDQTKKQMLEKSIISQWCDVFEPKPEPKPYNYKPPGLIEGNQTKIWKPQEYKSKIPLSLKDIE